MNRIIIKNLMKHNHYLWEIKMMNGKIKQIKFLKNYLKFE